MEMKFKGALSFALNLKLKRDDDDDEERHGKVEQDAIYIWKKIQIENMQFTHKCKNSIKLYQPITIMYEMYHPHIVDKREKIIALRLLGIRKH